MIKHWLKAFDYNILANIDQINENETPRRAWKGLSKHGIYGSKVTLPH